MENSHLEMIYLLFMVMVHSYVSILEGKLLSEPHEYHSSMVI